MNSKLTRTSSTAVAVALGAACLVSPRIAAQVEEEVTSSQESPQLLEKMIVTGSYLPTSAVSPIAPTTVFDRKAIEATGVNSNLLEALRRAAPQFVGGGNLGTTNANVGGGSTNGGSSISLRNAATLVLVNGRRVADSPVAGTGGLRFVDVNMIPMSAIKRVDVVTDGASALYGTDAIGGVVNIILEDDFNGAEIGGYYGFSDNDGSYEERSGYATIGTSQGPLSLTVSGEWSKKDPLFQYERPFSAETFGTTSFPGVIGIGSQLYFLNPSLNAPPLNLDLPIEQLVTDGVYSGPLSPGAVTELFNLARYPTLETSNDRKTALLAGSYRLNDRYKVGFDYLFSRTETFAQINGQAFRATIDSNAITNPTNVSVVARNRFLDSPRQYFNDTDLHRLTTTISGEIAPEVSFEAAGFYNRAYQEYRNPGLIDSAKRVAAVNSGAINMFARLQAPGAVAASGMVGTAFSNFTSELYGMDARVTYTGIELPAGNLGIVVGADARREILSGDADINSQPDPTTGIGPQGWDQGTTLSPFTGARTVIGSFVETRLPVISPKQDIALTHALEFSAAGRFESYSDTNNPLVPKLGVRWQPMTENFTVRAGYTEGFSAPMLYSLFGPTNTGFTPEITIRPLGGSADGDNDQAGQANSRTLNNKDLEPSESKNYNLGIVYSPSGVKGLTASVDYFRIVQHSMVSSVNSSAILQDVETRGAASPYAGRVAIGNYPGAPGAQPINAPGQILDYDPVSGLTRDLGDVYITNLTENVGRQRLDGVDVTLDYTADFGSAGMLKLNAMGTYFFSYEVQNNPVVGYVETAGRATFENGTIPEWRTYTSAEYAIAGVTVGLGWTHIPSVEEYDTSLLTLGSVNTLNWDSFNSFDAYLSYSFEHLKSSGWLDYLKGLRLKVGVNNLSNEFGPFSSYVATNANMDTSTYGSIGRFWYVQGAIKF